MQIDLDHAHIFASNMDETIRWWTEMLDAKVVFDIPLAGSRSVRLAVGRGALILIDAPPTVKGSGSVHHLGILTDDLEGLVASMEAKGVKFRDPIQDLGVVKLIMVMAPDDVFLELFQTATPGR